MEHLVQLKLILFIKLHANLHSTWKHCSVLAQIFIGKKTFFWVSDVHVVLIFQSVRWWSALTRLARTASILWTTDWSCTTRRTMRIMEDSDVRLMILIPTCTSWNIHSSLLFPQNCHSLVSFSPLWCLMWIGNRYRKSLLMVIKQTSLVLGLLKVS